MAKQEPITVEGIIKETLPGSMYRVEITIGENKHEVFPIPQDEILNSNNTLAQNDNY